MAAVIEQGLLCAVVADVAAGELCELRERGEKYDGRNVRTGFGRWEMPGISFEEMHNRLIMALTEEISFADGLVGERRIKGKSGRSHTKNHEQAGEESNDVTH